MQRLVRDPHDAEALNQAHQAGQDDPPAYATFLERVAGLTTDPVFAAHWYSEAAAVWQSLEDAPHHRRAVVRGALSEPAAFAAFDQLVQEARDVDDGATVVQLLECLCTEAGETETPSPELVARLGRAHEELVAVYAADQPAADPEKEAGHWAAMAALDPNNAYAIYQARELYKAASKWALAVPLFEQERALVDDPERLSVLYLDEADVCRLANDSVGRLGALQAALEQKEESGLRFEWSLAVVDCLQDKQTLDAETCMAAHQHLLQLAETYEGEHAFGYAKSAAVCKAGDDRAMQLADFWGEQLGRRAELSEQYRAYLKVAPDGFMAQKARDALASTGAALSPEPTGGDAPANAAAATAAPAVASEPKPKQPDQMTVPELLVHAEDLAQRGRKPQACDAFRMVLSQQPANVEALSWVEDFLRQRRKFSELQDVLFAAAKDDSQLVATRKAQLVDVAGICESKLRDFDAAISAWQLAWQLDRADEQARAKLFSLMEKQRRWDDLVPLYEQQAMRETDVETTISVERRLAELHKKQRQDPAAAAEAWLRIFALSPGDDDALSTAVDLYEQAQQLAAAVEAIHSNLGALDDDSAQGRLTRRLAGFQHALGDKAAAAASWVAVADLLKSDDDYGRAAALYVELSQWVEAAAVTERRSAMREGSERASLLAEAAELNLKAGGLETALAQFESASELDVTNDDLAAKVDSLYEQLDRQLDQVGFLLRRAEQLTAGSTRVAIRHRAAALQRHANDEDGARDTLLALLEDGADFHALQVLHELAEKRQDWEEAIDMLRRLVAVCENKKEKLAYAVREGQLWSDALLQLDEAVACYRRIIEEIDDGNEYVLHAIADLETRQENHQGASEILEKLLGLSQGPQRVDVAQRLAVLYEGPLEDAHAAIRNLNIVHQEEPEDFDAISRLQRLSEKVEDWDRVALFLGKLIEVEGDDEEASDMTRQLADVLVNRLNRGEDALTALEPLSDEGDSACQDAYIDLGVTLEKKELVAAKLVRWNESKVGSSRGDALRRAFELYNELGRDEEARTVAVELARTKECDATMAGQLEAICIRLKDLDGLGVAHDVIVSDLASGDRAEELVRQAEAMVEAAADAIDAIQHGELALAGVAPESAQGLLMRIAALSDAPGHIIDLFERQVARCKKPQQRVEALAQAALVAAERGAVDRAREFFNQALSGGVHEETLASLESAARKADASSGGDGKLIRVLAEALAAGGQGSRDGGRTRSALLRRAAQIAQLELKDTEAAFAWLSDSIIAHVDEPALEALAALGEEQNDPGRVDAALSRALEEVFDGPLVRKLLRRRANLRRDRLADKRLAADDLKRLHDLSPSDHELAKELEGMLLELGDHRGMIELLEDQILRGRQPHVRAELARKVACIWEEEIGDVRESLDAWRRVLRMKAGDQEAKDGLERAKAGKLKKAPPVRGADGRTYTSAPPKPSQAPAASAATKAAESIPRAAALPVDMAPAPAQAVPEQREELPTWNAVEDTAKVQPKASQTTGDLASLSDADDTSRIEAMGAEAAAEIVAAQQPIQEGYEIGAQPAAHPLGESAAPSGEPQAAMAGHQRAAEGLPADAVVEASQGAGPNDKGQQTHFSQADHHEVVALQPQAQAAYGGDDVEAVELDAIELLDDDEPTYT